MKEKHDSRKDNITPLFQDAVPQEAAGEESMLRFLDESDESISKRAFLNQCTLSEEALEQWQSLNTLIDAGKTLPNRQPDPAIRSRVLDAAFAAAQGCRPPRVSSKRYSTFPGWRWAWAALFLALLYSGYQEFQPADLNQSSSLTVAKDSLDYELLSLEAELEQIQTDLGLELNISLDGSA
ncbi:MAG: hypothetical protein JXR73_23420 [Candidatus Omnitrophica bacterium]|nr:hypothetical protein [Candidatus Omnitrophota bacterium]